MSVWPFLEYDHIECLITAHMLAARSPKLSFTIQHLRYCRAIDPDHTTLSSGFSRESLLRAPFCDRTVRWSQTSRTVVLLFPFTYFPASCL